MPTSDHNPDSHRFARITAVISRFIGYLIYAYLIFVEIFLGLAFFLLLFGANQDTGFVSWVYRSASQAMDPFRGVFQQFPVTNNVNVDAVFDPSILLAMIVYGVLAIALHSLLAWLTGRIRKIDVENRLEEQHDAYRQAANSYQAPLPNVMGGEQPLPAPDAGSAAGQAGNQAGNNQ